MFFWNICDDYLFFFNFFIWYVDIIDMRMDLEDDDVIYDDEYEDSYNELGFD